MSEENKPVMTDEAALEFLSALCVELLDVGEAHTTLIPADAEETSEIKVLMKANTMMVFTSLLLMSVVQDKMSNVAHLAYKIWTSPLMTDLNMIAFKEEINNVKDYIDTSVVDIEAFINKEKNGPSGEPSNGSSDL